MKSCWACGTQLPPEARYCPSCGSRVDEAPHAQEERKVVTVLFVDLVASTAQADRRDPEDVRATLRPFYDSLRGEIEGYGGRVEKFIGDAVMALFGAPTAHEDDPERAIRAALAIRTALSRLNEERGLALSVRVAVATGEALIDLRALEEGHGMAAGDVTNTGFRLAEAAPVDGILVDEPTYRATHQAIEFRDAEPVRAKGKELPQLVWEVVGPRGGYGDVDFSRPRLPFFGRRDALAALDAALHEAQAASTAQLVTVVGPAGIGKSRLLLEFASELDARTDLLLYWRQGRSLPYGEETPFWALAEIVRAHAGILRTDEPRAAEEKLRRAIRHAVPDETDAAWVETRMRTLVGLGGGGDQGRIESFAAWRRFFEGLGAHSPVVLAFEDVHWADEGLLEFIDHLAVWTVGVPLLIVCTARPTIFERHPGWGTAHADATLVTLTPLADGDTAGIVNALLGDGVPAEVERELLEHAEGNPLYALEYARMLVDRDFLRRDGDEWRFERAEELPLPESVQAIIAARIDALPPEEKRLLQAAAVVGRVFWLGALATLTGLPHFVAGERVERLERKGFLRRDRTSTVGGDRQYSFHHVLVRDIAYGQVTRAIRSDDHRRTAEWLDALKSDRADLAELIAHHYDCALDLAVAAGRDTSELATRARAALRDAADRAAALQAWPTAARLYRDALETWPEDDERPLVEFAFGRASFHAEGGGSDVLEGVVPKLLARRDRERAAEALVTLGDLSFRAGNRDAAFDRFGEAVDLLAEAPASPAKAYVLSTVARFHAIELDSEPAIAIGTEALAMADQLGLEDLRAHALNNVGSARFFAGDSSGIDDLEQSLRIALERNSAESIRASLNLGTIYAHFGKLEESFRVHAAGRRVAERLGDPAGIQWLAAERLWELYWRGVWDEAAAAADELLAELEHGAPRLYAEPGSRLVRSWIALARDELDAALAEVGQLCDLVEETDFVQMRFPALSLRARILAAAGQLDDAAAEIDDLAALWEDSGVAGSYWTADLAFAAVEADRRGPLLEPLGRPQETRWVEAARAVVAGDFVAAARTYAEIGSRPDEAVARVYSSTDVDAALGFFRSVGAARYARQAETPVTRSR